MNYLNLCFPKKNDKYEGKAKAHSAMSVLFLCKERKESMAVKIARSLEDVYPNIKELNKILEASKPALSFITGFEKSDGA